MPNGMYGGVRGKETKIGRKTFVSLPTRFPFSKKWTITEDKGENMKKKFIMHISDETKL